MAREHIKELFWKFVGHNSTTTGLFLKAAEIMTNPDLVNNNNKLSRRDFLKLSAEGLAALAIPPISSDKETENLTADIIPASQEFINLFAEGAKKREISIEGMGSFAVYRPFETTEFAILPSLEAKKEDGTIINSEERLFMLEYTFSLHGGKTKRIVELEKGTDTSRDGVPLIVWRYKKENPRPHKNAPKIISKDDVLWYPALTPEQWDQVKANPQSEDFYANMGFAPATSVLSNWLFDTSYNRDEGNAFVVDLNKLSNESHSVLLKRERRKSVEPLIKEVQKFFGEGFAVQPDGKVFDKTNNKEVPGLKIILFDENTIINTGKATDPKPTWAWERTCEFEGKTDFKVTGTQYDLQILENSGLDMYAHEYKAGEFTRQKVEFNNGVKMDAYSPQEVEYMIINNSSDLPEYRNDSYVSVSLMMDKILGSDKKSGQKRRVFYRGMNETVVDRWAANFIPKTNPNGTITEIQTSTFVVVTVEDKSKGLVAWYGADGKPVAVAIENKYNNAPYFFSLGFKGYSLKNYN